MGLSSFHDQSPETKRVDRYYYNLVFCGPLIMSFQYSSENEFHFLHQGILVFTGIVIKIIKWESSLGLLHLNGFRCVPPSFDSCYKQVIYALNAFSPASPSRYSFAPTSQCCVLFINWGKGRGGGGGEGDVQRHR